MSRVGNSQRQKVDGGLPGAGGAERKWLFVDPEFLLGVMKMF